MAVLPLVGDYRPSTTPGGADPDGPIADTAKWRNRRNRRVLRVLARNGEPKRETRRPRRVSSKLELPHDSLLLLHELHCQRRTREAGAVVVTGPEKITWRRIPWMSLEPLMWTIWKPAKPMMW